MANITTTILFIAALLVPSLSQSINVLYEWNYLNFTWPNEAAYSEALYNGIYIPKNNIVTGIKLWKDQIYLTLPRWKKGVPATLVTVPVNPKDGDHAPLLLPYPNWEMQRLGDCSALQFVQSMEIDPKGRMWVLENGRTEFRSENPRTECPSRLIIFDLENEGKILLDYRFPNNVVHRNFVFLNDIVLDHEDGGWAYITDSGNKFPGIIVFSLKDKRSWKISHNPTMMASPEAMIFNISGTVIEIRAPIDGIALSPASTEGYRTVYYTPLSSREMFTIPTRVLKNPRYKVKDYIRSVGHRSSTSDGLVITAMGDMYYGLLTEDSVSGWSIRANIFTEENQKLIFFDQNLNQWPDTFAVDEVGRLWWTTNRIPSFEAEKIDLTESNYRVIFSEIGDKSYMYYENFTSPKFPDITW